MNFKNYLICLITIFCLISILPTAFGVTEISVSNEADLLSNITAINTAVDAMTADSAYIITLTNNITLQNRIYFHNAHVTIQGTPGDDITITRAAGFSGATDTARSWFNPGMLEVAVYPDTSSIIYQSKNASITLKNITFDDADNPDTALMTNSTPASYTTLPATHSDRIYDSILSAYHEDATIILGEDAHLKNPGGWSAIYITGGATSIMEEGSSISDGKNTSFYLIRLAGASNLTVNGTIESNTNRGAIYVDNGGGGTISVNGIVKDNTFRSHAITFVNNAVIFGSKSNLTNNNVTGHLISLAQSDIDFYGNITANTDPSNKAITQSAIYSTNSLGNPKTLNFYGNISDNSLSHAIYVQNNVDLIIHLNSKISNNTQMGAGTIYVQSGPHVKVYGEISGNEVDSDNGGGIYLVHSSSGELFPSGNISNNKVNHGSGGGVYVNHNSTFTMHGGTISGNKALGAYSNSKDSGDYGGGGVSVIRNSTFIMDGGTINNNEGTTGGGVWVSGKTNTSGSAINNDGPIFIFNKGTIKDNIATDNVNVAYGNDVALVASVNGISGIVLPSSVDNGHHILISKDAVIGEGFIGVAQTDPSNLAQITGYHQAVYPIDKINSNMYIGTLAKTLEDDIIFHSSTQTTGYTKIDNSLWIASGKTSGKINFVTTFPDVNDNEYLVAIAALDNSLNIINNGGQIEVIRPSRTNDGLSIDITAVPSASSYGIVIFKMLKTNSFDLTTSYAGIGQFEFQNDPDNDNKVTLNPGDTADIDIAPNNGWYIQSIQLTAGDGGVFTKRAVNGVVTVNYNELADGTNNIHAVFAKNSSGGGSGSGSRNISEPENRTEQESDETIADPIIEPPYCPPAPPVSKSAEVTQLWVIAVAVFVFAIRFGKDDD